MYFQNKNFVIIGASSGTGLSIAQQLASQGANLFTFSRSKPSTLPPGASWEEADSTNENFHLAGLPDVVHGLVYCPGSINLKPFHRISPQDFRTDLDINVVGAFRAIQQVYPNLKAAGGLGSVVLFSTVAVQTGMPFHSSIAAAKGAVEGLVHALAAEWAPNIRINAIAPSLTDTPLAANLLSTEDKRNNAAQRHPLRRIGTPADLANATRFLLSDDAAFVTGQILHIDGGMGNLKT
ncbi:MAG: SDR family oxidoreductase [Lewinellaceae bacterium]|nr:SDR family oxidoreductase [Lewinellaceae bacterium]